MRDGAPSAGTGSTATLEVVELRKNFGGVQAVAGVSLRVAAGELLALIGPNGAGKSTCFNMLNGQLRPDGGSVRLKGRDITGIDRKSTRLNSSHSTLSRMPSSA